MPTPSGNPSSSGTFGRGGVRSLERCHLSPRRLAESLMSVSYTCPNPDCGVTLKTPNRVAAGKSVKCPKCAKPFVPEAEESAQAKTSGAKPPAAAPAPAAPVPFADDDEDAE